MSFTLDFENTQTAYAAKSNKDLYQSYMLFKVLNNSVMAVTGNFLLKYAVKAGLPIKSLLKGTLYRHFCGGETLEECEALIDKLEGFKLASVLDYGVEGSTDEKRMDDILEELLKSVEFTAKKGSLAYSVFKPTAIGAASIYEKVSQKKALSNEEIEAFDRIKGRFKKMFDLAYKLKVSVLVDAEESWLQDSIDELVMEMMPVYNKSFPVIITTYQMYLKDSYESVEKALRTAKKEGYILGAKLVRGAYLEKERRFARKAGIDSKVFDFKEDTDNSFDEGTALCIKEVKHVHLCIATHNEKSCMKAAKCIRENNLELKDERVWFSQLYGMCDHLSFNLAEAGFNVAKYIPYGSVSDVVPYLIRRAEENSSISGQSSRELILYKKEMKRRSTAG